MPLTKNDTARLLGDTITEEFFCVIGIQNRPFFKRMVRLLVRRPIENFADQAAAFDAAMAEQGLQTTTQEYLTEIVSGFEVRGAGNIPLQGPTIVASNHPGSLDILLLLAGIERQDIGIIASGAPFLKSLPNLSRCLFFSTSDASDRFQALRGALRHLQQGGCLVTFPTGLVDPDPAFMPGAEAAFERWHSSLALLMKKVPDTCLVPAIVSGVLEPGYYHHPLAGLFRDPIRRQKFSEYWMVIQILRQRRKFSLTPRVSFGRPCQSASSEESVEALMVGITSQARQLLADHNEWYAPQAAR